jgi:hypothetical protein
MRLVWRSWMGLIGVPIFALSVAVQYNDPDPLVWILIYGAAAVACGAAALGRRWLVLPAAVGLVALVWGSTLVPSALAFLRSDHAPTQFQMETGNALEEEARECGGLLIAAAFGVALAFDGWQARRR